MQALVLEKKGELSLREIALPLDVGPDDVRIAIHTVGICGSDVHYYTHGQIGPFKVEKPMILGHEASGIVIEAGSQVASLKVGDDGAHFVGRGDIDSDLELALMPVGFLAASLLAHAFDDVLRNETALQGIGQDGAQGDP